MMSPVLRQVFFFGTDAEMRNHGVKSHNAEIQRSKEPASPKPGVPHHLMRRRDVASSLQQEQRKRPGQVLHAKIPLQRSDERDSCARVFAMASEEIRRFLGPATSQPEPPNGSSLPRLRVRGMWFPSPCELPAMPHRSWWLRAVVPCRRHAGVTPQWCPRPTVPRARGTTHQR